MNYFHRDIYFMFTDYVDILTPYYVAVNRFLCNFVSRCTLFYDEKLMLNRQLKADPDDVNHQKTS